MNTPIVEKVTPGPWLVEHDRHGFYTGKVFEKHSVLDAPAIHKEPVAEVALEANAELIAKAPEMAARIAELEAALRQTEGALSEWLHSLMQQQQTFGEYDRMIERCKASRDKARALLNKEPS